MARSEHPKKEVEHALVYMEANGWRIDKGGHWGKALCPYHDPECRGGAYCIAGVWGTPKNPGNHAKQLRQVVDNCTMHRSKARGLVKE
jgi:hypothetical protein